MRALVQDLYGHNSVRVMNPLAKTWESNSYHIGKILAEHVNDEYPATFNRRYPHRYNEILEHEEDLQLSRRSHIEITSSCVPPPRDRSSRNLIYLEF